MKDLYSIAQISKQAFHQQMARESLKEDRSWLYIQMIQQARELHPVIGLEKIYYLFKPEEIGRDSFIHIGTLAGYALEKPPKTTFRGIDPVPYKNLLVGKYFSGVNQVWATDITYYKLHTEYYYISMIMDLYSRRILAHGLARTLHAHHSMVLLKEALKRRKLGKAHQLIHHSDRGIQYRAQAYLKLLTKHQIGISMCSSVFENTSMERLNGIIKNDYIRHWNPNSFSQLKKLLDRAVNNYNNCPHGELEMNSPLDFEKKLQQIPLNQRTKLSVYTFKKNKYENPDQLVLFH